MIFMESVKRSDRGAFSMNRNSTQPVTFADRYQSVLVPVIFEPWENELLRRAPPRPGEHVLDLACGTGVVTREIARSGVAVGSLTGADHSAGMLDVARQLAAQMSLDALWVEADAGALPFEADRFDLAFCQQALQFFPDRPAALDELGRVLKAGGRVAFCVQRALSENPMLRAQAEALEKNAGPDAGEAVRAICGLSDPDEIRGLFEDAGFRDIEIESVTLTLHHPDARAFASGAMGGMHTGDKLSGLENDRTNRAVEDFLKGLGKCFDGTGIRFPHVSNVIVARS
jgi:ubiquinone/menaquinone biosynthesis C-methylase UbiE